MTSDVPWPPGARAFALVALSVCGCGPAVVMTEAAPALVVHNDARTGEVRVLARACGEAAERARLIYAGAVAPGTTLRVRLARGCYDFDAVDARGRAVGRQHGVELRRPMEWRIAR